LLWYTLVSILVLGIGIASGQYYWVLDIGCLSWYRSNPSINCVFLSVKLTVPYSLCGCGCQTPEEHDAESEVRSKESRKYVINSLDDLVQVPPFQFHFGTGQSLLSRRLRPQSGPISHPLKYQILIGIFVIF